MAADRTAPSVRTLLTETRELPTRVDACPTLTAWTAADWRLVLADLPLNAATFEARFEQTPDRLTDDLAAWCLGFGDLDQPLRERYRSLYGNLGVVLLTMLALQRSETVRTVSELPVPDHDCDRLCRPLVTDAAVQEALYEIYRPGTFPDDEPGEDTGDGDLAADAWANVDTSSLTFHEHGTTSFILRGRSTSGGQGYQPVFALKCIVYPYLRIPTIARATRRYHRDYALNVPDLKHLVRTWASADSWIMMGFLPGRTLERVLAEELRGARTNGPLRLDLLDRYGNALFRAMHELDAHGLEHGDLSAANIIVDDTGGEPVLRLIDLGVNYLQSHSIPGRGGTGRRFVAPEVRRGGRDVTRADLYSVGQLLIAFGGVGEAPDGIVPDGFYAETALLARFIEDLIDHDPTRRLIVFRPEPEAVYEQLRGYFNEELTAMVETRKDDRTGIDAAWYAHVRELFRPLAGAPARQRRLWRVRRKQRLYRDGRVGLHVRWLLWWSMISSVAFFLTGTVVIMWWLRDLGWNWDNRLLEGVQKLTGQAGRIPLVDQLRAPDYRIPDLWGNFPSRLVCLSFVFVCAKYYQNLFAGWTPLVAGRALGSLRVKAIIAEIAMRTMTVTAMLLVLPPTLREPRWWPLGTSIGMTVTLLTNLACTVFALSAVKAARDAELTTVPRTEIQGLKAIRGWTDMAAFYAVCCWIIGLLIYAAVLHDTLVYASAVAAINLILFYVFRCGVNSAYVRVGLIRACLAAERLDRIARATPAAA